MYRVGYMQYSFIPDTLCAYGHACYLVCMYAALDVMSFFGLVLLTGPSLRL